MIFIFQLLSFKPAFHSPLSPLSRGFLLPLCFLHRVVSSAYLRLLIFLLIILILACASFFLTLHMMYSTYKLNRMVVIYSLDVLLSQLGTTLNVCNFYLSTIPQESWGENTSYPALNESLLLWNKQGRNKRQL